MSSITKPHWSLRAVVLGLLLIVLVVALAVLGYHRGRAHRNASRPAAVIAPPIAPPRPEPTRSTLVIPARGTISAVLGSAGLDPGLVVDLLRAARPVYNLGRVEAGHEVSLTRSADGGLVEVSYQIAPGRRLSLTHAADADPDLDGGWVAAIVALPIETQVVGVNGTVTNSLIGAVEAAGEQDQLGLDLAGIFGWQLDFYTDPRAGDTFRVLIEKRYVENHFSGYGNVLAAEYVNRGHSYRALRFEDADGNPAYYQPDGKPLKRLFLSSPLKFEARITSGFSLNRFHPILKVYRAHLGIDFAAPMGAPVQAIGSGVVTRAGNFGEDGNMVQVRHTDGYQTLYLHLSRILVHVGEHVAQGQQVGAVGMSGLATGPHLDFRIEQNGKFEDFEALRRKLPPDTPVSRSRWGDFITLRDRRMAQLDQPRSGPLNPPQR